MNVILVGDTAVGKTSLITNYLNNTFSEEYNPGCYGDYQGTKNVNGNQVNLTIQDTSGDEHLGVNRR